MSTGRASGRPPPHGPRRFRARAPHPLSVPTGHRSRWPPPVPERRRRPTDRRGVGPLPGRHDVLLGARTRRHPPPARAFAGDGPHGRTVPPGSSDHVQISDDFAPRFSAILLSPRSSGGSRASWTRSSTTTATATRSGWPTSPWTPGSRVTWSGTGAWSRGDRTSGRSVMGFPPTTSMSGGGCCRGSRTSTIEGSLSTGRRGRLGTSGDMAVWNL